MMMPCLFVWKRLLSLSLIVLDFVVANNDLAFNGDLGIAADPGWGTTTTKTDNQNDQWRGAHLSDNPAAIDQSGSWSTAGTDTYRDDGCRDANNGNNNLQTPKSKKRLRRRGCAPVSAPDRHRGSDTVPNGESIPSTPGDPQKLPEFDLPAKPAAKPDKKLCPDLLANYPVCDTGISIIPNPLAPGYVLLPRCHLYNPFYGCLESEQLWCCVYVTPIAPVPTPAQDYDSFYIFNGFNCRQQSELQIEPGGSPQPGSSRI